MMGILVPETCWGNKTGYFVASSWFFTFTVFSSQFNTETLHKTKTENKHFSKNGSYQKAFTMQNTRVIGSRASCD
jgi:hypothetical protein